MRRLLPLVGTIVGVLLAIATPASAKANIRVVIAGPGLVAPIELLNPSIDIGCLSADVCIGRLSEPEARLGPRYRVTQSFEAVHAGDSVKPGQLLARFRHDLYPYASGGPAAFTPPDQRWVDGHQIQGGWTTVSHSLIATLRANGLPAEPAERAEPAEPAKRPQIPASNEGAGRTLLGLMIFGALLTGGAFLGRPRRKHRSPGA